ncbi:MAG: DEAD/DEAH box helicase, partial [Treponema sp.]|nr:DEAD/DEAH box helicase [Treponema sp.]
MTLFHPLIQSWFSSIYGTPTPIQQTAWPLIAQNEHVLALAPTGSGKTLTAFLTIISRFADGTYPASQLSALYVSPLKALNEDIRRNLLEPISALKARFAAADVPFPEIRVETRSGDTPQAQRRRFLAKPPSILALTPESLAILLLNPQGRKVLSAVRCLIIDEIHAILGTKRGAFLSCQIDRLALTAGEFQRISLSATVRPPQAAAEFTGGLRASGSGYEARPVRIAAPPAEKTIELQVEFPPDDEAPAEPAGKQAGPFGKRYQILARIIIERILANRRRDAQGKFTQGTILVFTDSRRRAERIALLINQRAEASGIHLEGPAAFAHHGSLSREVRRAVEERLARGELPCVVATGSLELGIDIGAAAEVILAGCPASVSTALQRIGRSGHGVGMISRGRLIPFTGMDLIAAAALEAAVRDREIEETRPIENPLDILAQLILALCAEQNRKVDELYALVRGFWAFKTLSRSAYDLVVQMLTGRFAADRIRELKGRLYLDALTGELAPAPGLLRLLYASGGVITSRGYYSLRLRDGTKIGELDEEFVWERRLGDRFVFGTRTWTITAISSEAVEAVPLDKAADYAPFWKAEPVFRSPVLVRRILERFERFERGGGPLIRGTPLDEFIAGQRKRQGEVPLPGLRHIPIEIIDDPLNKGDSWLAALHSFRGGAVNYPLALALSQELEEITGLRVDAVSDDNAVLLRIPRLLNEPPEALVRRAIFSLGNAQRGEEQFKRRLESSGTFGAAFREAAERSLALPKAGFGKRSPLWIMRQRAKRLFDATAPYRDFPITAEAWRSCLRDQFDMEGFTALLAAIRDGSTAVSFFRSAAPSPFARDIIWKETNILMYVYDERPELRGASLSDAVIEAALGEGAGRPALPAALAGDFSARLRREREGWTAEEPLGLCEWVKERIAIPQDEWERLLAAAPGVLREALQADPGLGGRIGRVRREGAALDSLVHREWARLWRDAALTQLGPWLRYEGPVSLERLCAVFGVSPAEAAAGVDALAQRGILVRGVRVEPLAEGVPGHNGVICGADLICDRENLDLLLRLFRKQSRPAIRERPASLLVPFLARRQGILREGGGSPPWEGLRCFPAPAALWETELLPSRCPEYRPGILDEAIRAGKLLWYGQGRERIALCGMEDYSLVCPGAESSGLEPPEPAALESMMREMAGLLEKPRDFWEIKDALGLDSRRIGELLWEGA